MKKLLLVAAVVLSVGLLGCGGSSGSSDDKPSVAVQTEEVRQASEDFMNAAINREGSKICDLSSQEAIANMSIDFPAVGSDCDKGMEELFSKLPESAVEQDEEFLAGLAKAKITIGGDIAHVEGTGTDLEMVLADGLWLLKDTESSFKREEREAREKEAEEPKEPEEEIDGEFLGENLTQELEAEDPGTLYYVYCEIDKPNPTEIFKCEAEKLVEDDHVVHGIVEAEGLGGYEAKVLRVRFR